MTDNYKFRLAKHFINSMIVLEMRMNRISSVQFHNRGASIDTKEIIEPEIDPLSDDSEVDDVVEAQEVQEAEEQPVVVREYAVEPHILAQLKDHYTVLGFDWDQEGDKVTLAWS